jgi:SAM-dependent methyltransferase
MTTDPWTELADDYAAHRSGYSNELYDTIAGFGLRRGATILDLGCGTGIASEPFAANGFPVTCVDPSAAMLAKAKERLPSAVFVEAAAEALPFPNERFDLVISAGVFHWVDRGRAITEVLRVLRPGGITAIWWKHLMGQDAVQQLREDVFRSFGKQPPQQGLSGGFREFYASEGLTDQTLRVLPWRTSMPLDQYIGYERSRLSTRQTLGDRTAEFLQTLERRLRELAGPGNPSIPLAYVQYLYLAKKR